MSLKTKHRILNAQGAISNSQCPKRQARGQQAATANPVSRTTNPVLPLMESFYSLQGEGFHAGTSAYFIRLGGCDVGCHWCDVKESWDISAHPSVGIDEIAQDAWEHGPAIVVITGGEPLMHDLWGLTTKIHLKGLRTHLETSGTHQVSGEWDWICFSPKKFKKPLEEIYPLADELKIVIYNQSDFKWAEQHAAKVNPECKLYLQPEWSKADKNIALITDYITANPRWHMSIQTHKYLDLP